MSKANEQWHDAMQRAFVTQEDCTCPSKDHPEVRPHDDDCPVTQLRESLSHWEPEYGRIERALWALNKAFDRPARWLVERLGTANVLLVWLGVMALWVAWVMTHSGSLWESLATSVVTMYLGGLGGSLLGIALIARHRARVDQ